MASEPKEHNLLFSSIRNEEKTKKHTELVPRLFNVVFKAHKTDLQCVAFKRIYPLGKSLAAFVLLCRYIFYLILNLFNQEMPH